MSGMSGASGASGVSGVSGVSGASGVSHFGWPPTGNFPPGSLLLAFLLLLCREVFPYPFLDIFPNIDIIKIQIAGVVIFSQDEETPRKFRFFGPQDGACYLGISRVGDYFFERAKYGATV